MRSSTLGMFLAGAAGVCWGAMGVVGQVLITRYGFTPENLTVLRLLGGGAALLAFARLAGFKVLSVFREARDARDTFAYGLLIALMQYTFFVSVAYAGAGTAAVLSGAIPVFIVLLDALVARRKPGFAETSGIVLAVSGIFLLVTNGDLSKLSFSNIGALAGIASAAAGALTSIEPRRLIRKVPPVLVVGWGLLIGGMASAALLPHGVGNAVFSAASVSGLLFVILVGTAAAFFFYMTSLRSIPASTAGLLSVSEPLSSVTLSSVIVGTALTGLELLGALLIMAMTVIVSLSKREVRA